MIIHFEPQGGNFMNWLKHNIRDDERNQRQEPIKLGAVNNDWTQKNGYEIKKDKNSHSENKMRGIKMWT